MRKGFTLIELLAVIVILAVISLIAVPRIMDAIDQSRTRALIQNSETLLKSTKAYLASNSEVLPEELGDTIEVSIDDLILSNDLNEIQSPFSNDNCGGYVLVSKIDGGYHYRPFLNCFNGANNSLDDQLLAYFKLDGNAYDLTPNNNHGMIINALYHELSNSYDFEDDEAGIHFEEIVMTDDLTISYSFNTRRSSNYRVVNATGFRQTAPWHGNSSRLDLDDRGHSGEMQRLPMDISILTNAWYHLTLTRENNITSLYINGEKVSENDVWSEDAGVKNIGYKTDNTGWSSYRGKAKEVMLYDRALNENEVKKLYEWASR